MAKHDAVVEWTSSGDFMANGYSRGHEWRFDGGAVVRGSSSPHVVPVPLSDPAGVDPEEAVVAAASSCHMLWFLDLARRAGFEVASYRDEAVGEIGRDERGRLAFLVIRLRPAIAFVGTPPDSATLGSLHDEAHEKCFIANSLRCGVVVESPS